MQHADHFTRILNEKESFRREKLSDDKNQNKSDLIGDNIENSEQDFPEDVVETSKDESKIQNSEKAQAEIN